MRCKRHVHIPEQSRQVAGNYYLAAQQAASEGKTDEAQDLRQSAKAHEDAANAAE
ncbi:hypothetical protein GWI34_17515 [Actinomadura sp. DSM 109109]|nr:hypothetical protein [Actinomadura lepetitiana]